MNNVPAEYVQGFGKYMYNHTRAPLLIMNGCSTRTDSLLVVSLF